MTPTNSFGEINSLAALNATTKATGKGTLGQADFLKLMTTQLNAQDPLNPMENKDMVTQLSQFSSTAGIAEINASLKAISAKLEGSRIGDAATWIGHDALVAGDFVNRGNDGTYSGQVNLDSAADSVTIDLLDTNGLIVNSQTSRDVGTGPLSFAWDGIGENSTATGQLRVRVTARDTNGGIVPTTTNIWTPVTAVQSPAGGSATRLVTPNGLIAPEAVIRLG
jgi:flagellar basal-body rod modification protein FlgD